MRVSLPYGITRICARWGGAARVLASRGVRAARAPGAVVRRALAHPVASPELRRLARGAAGAVVVVSDHTRQTAARDVLPAVFEELAAAGIPARAVRVLVAYGNHARASGTALRGALGALPRGATLAHHDSADAGALCDVGALPSGERLALNRLAVEAPVLVVTGAITFHYHAGFTGGRKAVLPGIAARANILANHAHTLAADGPGGRSPRCAPGMLAGNPVSEEMDAAARLLCARLARPPFLVNAVLAEEGGLCVACAGDLFEAFARGAAWVDAHFRAPVDRPFDVAIASAGGAPRDSSFYQAHKAFDHAARAVRDGGVAILAARCPEGAGPGFLDWFRFPDYDTHLAALRGHFTVPGQTALALRQKLRRIRGILVSTMPARDVEAMGMTPARTLAEGFARAREMTGMRAPRACVVPHASMVLPTLRGAR